MRLTLICHTSLFTHTTQRAVSNLSTPAARIRRRRHPRHQPRRVGAILGRLARAHKARIVEQSEGHLMNDRPRGRARRLYARDARRVAWVGGTHAGASPRWRSVRVDESAVIADDAHLWIGVPPKQLARAALRRRDPRQRRWACLPWCLETGLCVVAENDTPVLPLPPQYVACPS